MVHGLLYQDFNNKKIEMKTKIKTLFITLILVVSAASYGQVRIVNTLSNTIATSSSAFIDASSTNANNSTLNIGKGLVYPRMDLTKFDSFSGSGTIGLPNNYPGRYDGMQVYNTGTGKTLSSASDIIVDVVPGFWYYKNKSTNVKGGTWTEIGNVIKNIATATEVATAISIDGIPVYATKGTFTTVAGSATTTIVPPADITGVYRISIYKNNGTTRLASSVYAFDIGLQSDNVTTGNYPFSEIYPAGIYNYTLEYFK